MKHEGTLPRDALNRKDKKKGMEKEKWQGEKNQNNNNNNIKKKLAVWTDTLLPEMAWIISNIVKLQALILLVCCGGRIWSYLI